jgi:iron complex transport system substrate-binding protein
VKICSLFPGATEMLFAIGAGSEVVAVSHECDWPPEVQRLPRVVRPKVDSSAPAAEIDRQVRELVARGESLYALDGDLLEALEPDLIVTQELCHVCAASPDDLGVVLGRLSYRPQVLSLAPGRIEEIWQAMLKLGEVTGHLAAAQQAVAQLRRRADRVARVVATASRRPRVLCLEWLDPPYVGGHWVPEMVQLAGGDPVLGEPGVPSVPLSWEKVLGSQPDYVIVMPCGYSLGRAVAEYSVMKFPASWQQLPAVIQGKVYAVEANSYFSRSGPRIVDGIEILGRILHPDVVGWSLPEHGWNRLIGYSSVDRPAETFFQR